MNDSFTNIEKKYTRLTKAEAVWEHPVVQCLMSLLDVVPGLGTIIDASIKLKVKDFQKKKLENLFMYILEDSYTNIFDEWMERLQSMSYFEINVARRYITQRFILRGFIKKY